jgi:hypothetical protein
MEILAMFRSKKKQNMLCPISACHYETTNSFDLLRHMIESERHKAMGHSTWVLEAFGAQKDFAELAFGKGTKIADLFDEYCFGDKKFRNLPENPSIFYEWLLAYRNRQK